MALGSDLVPNVVRWPEGFQFEGVASVCLFGKKKISERSGRQLFLVQVQGCAGLRSPRLGHSRAGHCPAAEQPGQLSPPAFPDCPVYISWWHRVLVPRPCGWGWRVSLFCGVAPSSKILEHVHTTARESHRSNCETIAFLCLDCMF